ncbi:prephenate dehydrogenase [Crassaminicella thermophila]|uniref:Prephenate dehydrogenase n=1 Tax=Crassaminicella thermophila TaxID=2599308 RepID=A0A5C0SB12_CRATE|nr:prephenate dehydrogenase [Crassaminicella thermophila]QEK11765.1 prephenate dehydrogenase [Crassaminicella thermophila]
MEDFDFNITIVGLGLIGASFAMALKELNPKNLWAVDIDMEAIETAQELGMIDKGYLEPEIPLKNSDIVIMCVYPNLTIKFIKDNMNYMKVGAIITDTAGIKKKVLDEINSFIREDLDFIGGHPMAGREYKGIGFAKKDIFKDANYILTPTNKNKKKNIELIEKIIKGIGCKNITKVTPKKHDEIIAFTSQLPHIIAAALINGSNKDDNLFTAGSFKDATRVAKMNTELWAELLMENRDNTIKQINIFEEHITKIKNAIIKKDKDRLEALFENARNKREAFIEKCMK